MTTTINGSSTSNLATALFDKLDTKKQGYIEQADLQTASGSASDAAKTAEVFKALDGDSNGKVTKSELSVALQKVGDELNAQADQSRVATASADAASGAGGAKGPPPAGAGGPPAGGGGDGDGGGASKAASGAATTSTSSTASTASTASTVKYVAAADTDNDGTVTDAEQAAYEKAQAAAEVKSAEAKAAELKALTQVDEYKVVSTSGDVAQTSSTAVDVSA